MLHVVESSKDRKLLNVIKENYDFNVLDLNLFIKRSQMVGPSSPKCAQIYIGLQSEYLIRETLAILGKHILFNANITIIIQKH